MGQSHSFESTASVFNTRFRRSKDSSQAESNSMSLEEKMKKRQEDRKSRVKFRGSSRARRRSVSADVRRSQRRQSSAIHENLVKINFVRNIRDVYSGVDSDHTQLGEGTWGQVKLVRRRSNPKSKAAVKILKLTKDMKSSRMKELRSEISLLQKIDHPHIAKLYETYEEESCNLYLVMEYLSGGELFDRVISLGHFRESKAAEAVKQMVGAVQYLHSKGIVHRDLKLENFMYRSKDSDRLVLIDFGLSTRYIDFDDSDASLNISKKEKFLSEMVGSSYYMAPEVMKRKYGKECDLWSIGVIAYMLLSGHPPFAGDTDEQIMRRVRKGVYHFNHSAFKKVTENSKDFVTRLLQYNPKQRLTAKQALEHGWLSDHHRKQMNRRSLRRASVMDREVVSNLNNFVKTNRFKRLALQAVAYSTNYEDIKHLQELFEDIDEDQDGYITLKELEKAMKDHPGVNKDTVKRIFEAMDVDKTKKVHLNEFIAATMNKSLMDDERILREAFRKLDVSETGEINQNDLMELLGQNYSKQQVQRMISEFKKKEAAVTKSGKIKKTRSKTKATLRLTQEEFIKAMRQAKVAETQSYMSLRSRSASFLDDDDSSVDSERVPI